MDPKEIVKLIKKWIWILLLGLILGSVGGWLFSRFQTPIYQASTKIMVTNAPESGTLSAVGQSTQELYDIFIELLVTSPILDATTDLLGYRVSANQITIEAKQLIRVIVKDEDSAHAAEIANTLVSVFIDQYGLMQTNRYSSSEESLQAQIQQVEAQIVDLQNQLLQKSVEIQDRNLQSVSDIISGLQTEISTLREDIIRLQYVDQLVDSVAPDGRAVRVTPTPTLDELIQINRSNARLTELQSLLSIYQQIYVNLSLASGNPEVQQGEENNQIIAALGLYQQIYSNLLSNYESIRLTRLQSTPNIVQVEKAFEPGKPISPKVPTNIVIGGILGLFLFGVIAFLIEYFDDSIRDANMINDILGLPVLGYIGEMELGKDHNIPYVLKKPRSPISEAFRSIRSNLEFSSVDHPLRSILITSASAGIGKTTIAVNLAMIIAQSGKRVVIVDCDLRRPHVHEKLALSNRKGLSDLLRMNISVEEVIQKVDDGKLSVITSGSLPPNPAELISSDKMFSILETLKQKYDVVVFDSVPYFLADAQALASRVDGVLIVIQPGKSSQSSAVEMLDQMDRKSVKPLGVVLNRVKEESGSEYYQSIKGYDHFAYEKASDSEPKEK